MISELIDLRVIQPALKRQIQRRQFGEAGAEGTVGEQAFGCRVAGVQGYVVGVPRNDVADAAEAAAGHADVAFEGFLHLVAEGQIDVPDNAGAQPGRAVDARRAHRGDAVDEFGFTDRAEMFRPIGAMEGAGLDEDGAEDVVAGIGIGQKVLDQIAPAWTIPEMVMRVDDLALG